MPLFCTIDSKNEQHGVQRELGMRLLRTEQVTQFRHRKDFWGDGSVRNELKKRPNCSPICGFDGALHVGFSHETPGNEWGLS